MGFINNLILAKRLGGSSGGGDGELSRFAQMAQGAMTEITTSDLEGVTTIANYVFCSNHHITKVTIPDNIQSIAQHAFSNMPALETVNLLGTVKLANYAFYANPKLKNLDWSKINSFGEETFANCLALTDVTVYVDITKRGVFYLCKGITNLTILDGVTQLAQDTFSTCSALKTVVLPDSLVKLGYACFQNCTGLESVVVSKNVEKILGATFSGCTKLKSVTMRATTPRQLASNAFSNCSALAEIIVPIGCGEAYKNATNWSAYADIIVEGDV